MMDDISASKFDLQRDSFRMVELKIKQPNKKVSMANNIQVKFFSLKDLFHHFVSICWKIV